MNEPIVLAMGLRKSFGDIAAVEDVSFSIEPGELFGFLGPNGAGETTTINMLTGLARPDSGRLSIAGIELPEMSRLPSTSSVLFRTRATFTPNSRGSTT
ncbi:MAG: ATP-binding cassette domain-containing protein [Desulfobacterales bacterium]|nr:ATP-binding cassette domain-containing protein [Desulfobacterales bacterium]